VFSFDGPLAAILRQAFLFSLFFMRSPFGRVAKGLTLGRDFQHSWDDPAALGRFPKLPVQPRMRQFLRFLIRCFFSLASNSFPGSSRFPPFQPPQTLRARAFRRRFLIVFLYLVRAFMSPT